MAGRCRCVVGGALKTTAHARIAAGARCRCTLVVAFAAVAAACESPLNLDGVEARLTTPIRRNDLLQVAAGSETTLVVAGNHGLVLRSGDGGVTWARQELPEWPALIDLAVCPDGRFAALAAEGQVLVSTDGGLSWQSHPIETEESPQGISCDPRDRLWVVGSFSTIMVSEDGGSSWDDRSIGDDTIFTTVQFIDEQHAVIFGEFGSNVWSADAGDTWTVRDPLPNEFYAQDAWFADARTGWVAGLAGQIQYTADGGASWSLQQTPTLAPIYGLAQAGDGLYAVGGEGVLLRHDDGGWARVDHGLPIRLLLRAVQAVGDDRLVIGGAGGALYVVPIGDTGAAAADAERSG